jgi:hypothetical protein
VAAPEAAQPKKTITKKKPKKTKKGNIDHEKMD